MQPMYVNDAADPDRDGNPGEPRGLSMMLMDEHEYDMASQQQSHDQVREKKL